MIIGNSNFARKAWGVCAAAAIAVAVHVTVSGQATLNITFPERIVAGPDFATDVLKNAWDFSEASDISPDPGETTNWTNFGVAGGLAGGHTSSDDSTMGLLTGGYYLVNNAGVNGVRFPIDTSKYKKLSFRMSASVPGNDPQIYWFQTSVGDPGDTFSSACGPNTCGVAVASKTVVGYKTFVVDLTAHLGGTPWTTGVVRGLRLDPNNTPAPIFGPTGANQDFFYDWVRLTAADNEPGAAMQTIQWSGGSGPTTIDVYDGTNTTLILNVATTSAGATSYSWNSGVLPPGAYTFRLSRTGATGTKVFTINTPPRVTVTDPSPTSGQDYATTVLGNAWDMSSAADIVIVGFENFTPVPPDFTGGILTATNTNNDPNITLLHNNNNAGGTKAIDSSKYRYLTYRMSIDGPVDVGNGSIVRVLWGSGALPNSLTTTRDILVFAGMQSYTLDLASFPDAPAGGIDHTGPAGSTETWLASNKRHLRFDPHEFGTNPGDPMPVRTFHIDDIKLTANPVAFGSYTIHFVAPVDPDGDTVIVNLYRDTDRDPNNGKTDLALGLTAASGSYLWNTTANGVPEGTYYIYAEATDSWQVSGSYSDAPLVVSAPCTYALAPAAGSVPNGGGSSTFGLTTGSACDWTAASNASFITITSSLVGTGSSTISYTVAPNPARTVRTGTLTVGGQTFTVTQLPSRGPYDFDGDGRADRTVYSPGSGVWSTQNGATRQYGLPGDIPVPGDYNGDGVLDTAVYRPSTGDWFVQGQASFNWGRSGDVPVPADYNGDGVTDAAVFRTTDSNNGAFFVRGQFVVAWGLRGDIPLAADFDGDGKADLAVFRQATGQWFLNFSSFNYTTTASYFWGVSGDIPLTGDFDGDGKADIVAYRPSIGGWFLAFSSGAPAYSTNAFHQWGIPGDLPLALDMDGDRVDDLVVFRRSDATWWTKNRVTGAVDGVQFGASGDLAALERPQFHPRPAADFDGDRRADITVFRPGTGQWFSKFSSTDYATTSVQQWGLDGDVKVPGDYDGDGKTDLAIYRPSDQIWYVKFSRTNFATTLAVRWGLPGDVPLPADYDGDGRTDLAIYRPSSGEWYRRLSGGYTPFLVDQFGVSSDIPVPADYDGDGRADLAVYRPSSGQWYLKLSSGAFGGVIVKPFGLSGDVPTPSDWDGDGRADLAVFRPSTAEWFGADALTPIQHATRLWGEPGDLPLAQDFDADGVIDTAVFRPSTGQWFVKLSSTPTGTLFTQWGLLNDQPVGASRRNPL